MAKRRVTTFDLGKELHSNLQKANLKTVEDVLSKSFLQLMGILHLSAPETEKLIIDLSSACLPICFRGNELLELENENVINFGNSKLDHVLQGGIKRGALTEFTGPPGVGKTQMCLHFSLKCLEKTISHNGICCIDTEGSFRSERLLEILQHSQAFEGREEEIISKFHVFQPKTISSLTEILSGLELFCIDKDIGLLVVDSVASLARKEFSRDTKFHRAATLASWAAQFKALAHQLNIAVIVTNQITSKVAYDENSDEEKEIGVDSSINKELERKSFFVGPALGNTWTHFVNTRLILQFVDSETRQLIIAKSPVAPIAVMNYNVTSAGIRFIGDLLYSFSGMNPNDHRIKTLPSFLN